MRTSKTLAAAVVAASMMTLATAASAGAPAALSGAGQAMKTETGAAFEPIYYRCWWNGHRRVCAWARPAPLYNFYYAPPRPSYYGFYGYGRGYGYGRSYGFRRH
jgi:hypothetical protein